MNTASLYTLYQQHPNIQTDTRKLQPGDIFFALKGENFNGNQFAQQAIKSGAAYAIVDEEIPGSDERIILVENVLATLQELAKHHRQQFAPSIPFIAITGSNGKTTTKELIHTALSSTYKTYTTEGNLNNHIGIPLTLLRVQPDAEMAVIEMGANHLKEIEGYCKYTLPTHGLITNCGKAHLEGFGGVEGVKKGKGELFDYLRANNGTAFVFWDYDYLQEMSKGIPEIIRYGTRAGDVVGRIITAEPFLTLSTTKGSRISEIKTKLVGSYNLPNVLAAVTIANHFNIGGDKIKTAIEGYKPSNSRSQLLKWKNNTIILDAYNANPSSMKLAIENFAGLNASDKILLLGAMAELGDESLQEHEAIVELIKSFDWKQVALVGGDFQKLDHPYKKFNTSKEAGTWLKEQGFSHAHLLVKGSRSMQMEKVLE